MSWVDYCRKKPWVEIIRDYREYRALRGQLWQAQSDLEYAEKLLVKEYEVEDDIKRGDACLKHKQIIEAANMFDKSACRYTLSRCRFFEPIGDENLCPNHMCSCWAHNNRYHQDLNQVKELTTKVSNFWADKFAKVK